MADVPDDRDGWQELTNLIAQMMFVSGETADVAAETTSIVEEIVRDQVQEMVSISSAMDNLKEPLISRIAKASYQSRRSPWISIYLY